MKFLKGIISNRLRGSLPKSDPSWTPKRPPDSKPKPKTGVQGVQLSPGNRNRKAR